MSSPASFPGPTMRGFIEPLHATDPSPSTVALEAATASATAPPYSSTATSKPISDRMGKRKNETEPQREDRALKYARWCAQIAWNEAHGRRHDEDNDSNFDSFDSFINSINYWDKNFSDVEGGGGGGGGVSVASRSFTKYVPASSGNDEVEAKVSAAVASVKKKKKPVRTVIRYPRGAGEFLFDDIRILAVRQTALLNKKITKKERHKLLIGRPFSETTIRRKIANLDARARMGNKIIRPAEKEKPQIKATWQKEQRELGKPTTDTDFEEYFKNLHIEWPEFRITFIRKKKS